ncbi:Hypothetical predicted protein [Pelobates cultripes]|uniref:Uncharacterized protein n=1 Tax=Pelobates cultripes TaxID=61616 RepID=A0AAD1RY52_PELCU|nr:Hypothetical predicted protein [Pelobates cultripes]
MEHMVNIRTFFRTDLAVVREEVLAVTDRVKATDKDISSLSQHQAGTTEQSQPLQTSPTAMQVQLDTLDNARWHNNLKVRGIVEFFTDGELPHFFRHLFSALLPQLRRKNYLRDSTHRLPKSEKAPLEAPRDVLLRVLIFQDKLAIQEALKSKTPLKLEGMQLTFLQDLCRATLEWRRSIQEVTTVFREMKISYRWGPFHTRNIPAYGLRDFNLIPYRAGSYTALGLHSCNT